VPSVDLNLYHVRKAFKESKIKRKIIRNVYKVEEEAADFRNERFKIIQNEIRAAKAKGKRIVFVDECHFT
jgi:hypothetical protein